jgi:hypothetical protein
MSAKPRYWQVAFPLTVIALCVAPHEFFLQNWMSGLENSIVKLKVRSFHHQKLRVLTWTCLGTTGSPLRPEWYIAPSLDIPVSLQGICLDFCGEVRKHPQNYFSAQSDIHIPR